MLGLTLSAMGNGMVMPFYFIYLTNIRGIDTAIAGLILGWGGVVALAAAPLMGTGIDRFGGKRVLPLALLISSLGSSHGLCKFATRWISLGDRRCDWSGGDVAGRDID